MTRPPRGPLGWLELVLEIALVIVLVAGAWLIVFVTAATERP